MRARYPVVPDIKKIAVLRANSLGDFIFSLPALEALRAAYPRAEIVLLAREWHAAFLQNRPGPVDRVIAIPAYWDNVQGLVAEDFESDFEKFMAELAGERFDAGIQIHGGGLNSNPIILRLGAKLTAGLKTQEAEPLDRWVPYHYYQPEILRYLEVVSLLGASPVTLEPEIAVKPEDLAESFSLLPETNSPLVALHPGASDPRRRWPIEKFARIGDMLARQGAQVVITGIEAESDLTNALAEQMQEKCFNSGGRLSLNGLTGLLSRCRLVISNDSGPLHLGAAVGAATVGIYWCGNMINAGPITRTCHRPVTSWRLNCPVCGADCTRESCEHRVSFVSDVPAEEVLEQALDLLQIRATM